MRYFLIILKFLSTEWVTNILRQKFEDENVATIFSNFVNVDRTRRIKLTR